MPVGQSGCHLAPAPIDIHNGKLELEDKTFHVSLELRQLFTLDNMTKCENLRSHAHNDWLRVEFHHG